MYVYVYVSKCVHLPKAERKVKLSYFFPYELFLFCFYFKGRCCVWGEVKGGFLFFLWIFFLYPCLLVLRVIIQQGLLNCQMQQKIIRPLLFPAPTLAFSSNKSSLCCEWSSFHRDPSSSHKLGTLFYFIYVTSYKFRETRDVAADALPQVMLPINTCQLEN